MKGQQGRSRAAARPAGAGCIIIRSYQRLDSSSGRDRRLEQPQDAYLSRNLLRRGLIVNDAYHNHAALSHSGAFAFRLQCSLRNLSVGLGVQRIRYPLSMTQAH